MAEIYHQWYRDRMPIPGATSDRYTYQASDNGHDIEHKMSSEPISPDAPLQPPNVATMELAQLIAAELVAQGNELDDLGDCESVVVMNSFVCLNLIQLSEKIIEWSKVERP